MKKNNLIQERKESGWTQAFVAQHLGIKQAHYCLIENGKRDPSMKVLKGLEELFGKPYDYLLSSMEDES